MSVVNKVYTTYLYIWFSYTINFKKKSFPQEKVSAIPQKLMVEKLLMRVESLDQKKYHILFKFHSTFSSWKNFMVFHIPTENHDFKYTKKANFEWCVESYFFLIRLWWIEHSTFKNSILALKRGNQKLNLDSKLHCIKKPNPPNTKPKKTLQSVFKFQISLVNKLVHEIRGSLYEKSKKALLI